MGRMSGRLEALRLGETDVARGVRCQAKKIMRGVDSHR